MTNKKNPGNQGFAANQVPEYDGEELRILALSGLAFYGFRVALSEYPIQWRPKALNWRDCVVRIPSPARGDPADQDRLKAEPIPTAHIDGIAHLTRTWLEHPPLRARFERTSLRHNSACGSATLTGSNRPSVGNQEHVQADRGNRAAIAPPDKSSRSANKVAPQPDTVGIEVARSITNTQSLNPDPLSPGGKKTCVPMLGRFSPMAV